MPGALTEAWDRVVASDPGLTRLRMASAGAVSIASALAVEYLFAMLTHAQGKGVVIAMLLGAVLGMMGSMALAGGDARTNARTAVFFPVAMGIGMVLGILVGSSTLLMLSVFVLVMFVAVAIRRFGIPFFFYGFMGWMGYFFASFLHATFTMLPALLAAVVVASVWVLLLSVTVLRTNATRTLRRIVRAFGARSRAVSRACADLLADEKDRPRRVLHARQRQLAEAALMVEAWSAERNALPAGSSGPALRRRLIDAQQVSDRLANAALGLTGGDAELRRSAATIADRLARRDDTGAEEAARTLAETAERNAALPAAQRAAGWRCARQFAAAALDFLALARRVHVEERHLLDEFSPVVELAMGNLPGSPRAAADVPARGIDWNPLARLDLTTRQAIQVAIAGTLAIIAGREISPTRYYWAVIAAFIMFAGTATRAETFIKGAHRVLGTLVGLFASVWLAELTAGSTAAVLTTVVACMFFGFYLLRVSYAYLIFFVTIMVGQLYVVLHEFSTGLLVLRLEETAAGAAIGFLVSLVFIPLSTRDTVRTARDAALFALADLLDAAADRLGGITTEPVDLDASSRTLDDRLRLLATVARPLTMPLLPGNSPARMRHRLTLYASTDAHARALAVQLRGHRRSPGLAAACRELAAAARMITENRVGKPQPATIDPLNRADSLLFSHAPAAPGARDTDPVLRALISLEQLLRGLAVVPPAPQQDADDSTAAEAELLGTITDSRGEPIHGRVVLIRDSVAQQRLGMAYSDAAGCYRLAHCPPGRYLALVTATAHRPRAIRVDLRSQEPLRTDVALVAEPIGRRTHERGPRVGARYAARP